MVPCIYLILNDFYKQYFEYAMSHFCENFITTLQSHALQLYYCFWDSQLLWRTISDLSNLIKRTKKWSSLETFCDRATSDYNVTALPAPLCWGGNDLRKSSRWHHTSQGHCRIKGNTRACAQALPAAQSQECLPLLWGCSISKGGNHPVTDNT